MGKSFNYQTGASGKWFVPKQGPYSGPSGISPTNKPVAKGAAANTVMSAFHKSFKNPQYLPGQGSDSDTDRGGTA
jgi:hypothetical protein